MAHKVRIPDFGEDAGNEATVTYWQVTVGDHIDAEEDLVELTTDKAVFNVPAPVSGTVKELMFEEGDVVNVGDVIAIIEED